MEMQQLIIATQKMSIFYLHPYSNQSLDQVSSTHQKSSSEILGFNNVVFLAAEFLFSCLSKINLLKQKDSLSRISFFLVQRVNPNNLKGISWKNEEFKLSMEFEFKPKALFSIIIHFQQMIKRIILLAIVVIFGQCTFGGLPGSGSGVLGSLAAVGVVGAAKGALKGAVAGAVNGLASGATIGSSTGENIGGAVGSVFGTVGKAAGQAIGTLVGSVTGGAVGGLAGGAIGAVTGGLTGGNGDNFSFASQNGAQAIGQYGSQVKGQYRNQLTSQAVNNQMFSVPNSQNQMASSGPQNQNQNNNLALKGGGQNAVNSQMFSVPNKQNQMASSGPQNQNNLVLNGGGQNRLAFSSQNRQSNTNLVGQNGQNRQKRVSTWQNGQNRQNGQNGQIRVSTGQNGQNKAGALVGAGQLAINPQTGQLFQSTGKFYRQNGQVNSQTKSQYNMNMGQARNQACGQSGCPHAK